MGELLKAKVRRGGGARAFGPHPALRWLPHAAVRFSGVQEDSGAWLWCSGDDMVIDAIRKASLRAACWVLGCRREGDREAGQLNWGLESDGRRGLASPTTPRGYLAPSGGRAGWMLGIAMCSGQRGLSPK